MLKLYFGNMQFGLILKSLQMLISHIVNFFALKFANVLGLDEEKLELLHEHFYEYKTLMTSYLMRFMKKLFRQKQLKVTRKSTVNVIWNYLQKMRSPVGPNYQFKLLFEVAQIVLTIPHSNAVTFFFHLITRMKMRVQTEID